MNLPRSMVEAGAKHMHAESQTCVYTDKGEEWARLDARSKESWMQLAEPILRAAIGCAEVVATNGVGSGSDFRVSASMVSIGPNAIQGQLKPFEFRRGDTILILRADAGEGENG